MTHKGVLWDMDGVLVDTGDFHYRSWAAVLGDYDIEFSRDFFRDTFGMNNRGILSILLGEKLTPDLLAEIGGRKEAWFRGASADDSDAAEIEALLEERQAAKARRDFDTADRIREGLAARGIQIEEIIREIPGARNPYAERIGNKPYIEIAIDRKEAARYGVKVGDIQHLLMTAVGGMEITTTLEGRERYAVRIRYLRELRDDIQSLGAIYVPTASGAQIPLSQMARIQKVEGPAKITGENTLPYVRVFVDVDTDSVGVVDFVKEAQRAVSERVHLSPGTYVSWSGQYEYELQARKRLSMVIPSS